MSGGQPPLLVAQGDDDLLGGDDLDLSDGDDLLGGDDLLDGDEALGDDETGAKDTQEEESTGLETARAAHDALFAENRYPSASTCKGCHPKHYKEWSV